MLGRPLQLCSYSAAVAENVVADCVLPDKHEGPCFGKVPIASIWYVWCGRVCVGCSPHGDPDYPMIIKPYRGDIDAVLIGTKTLHCELPEGEGNQ